MVNDHDDYSEQIQKFEDEVDFHIDKVIKSIHTTENILTACHNEK